MAEPLNTKYGHLLSGKALPFGASRVGEGVNFAVFSKLSTEVTLCLFRANEIEPAEQIPLDPKVNRTGHIWHIQLENLKDYVGYSYRLNALEPNHDFLDPYAKESSPAVVHQDSIIPLV